MTGILIDTCCCSNFYDIRIHDCLAGIQIVNADSDTNQFKDMDVGDCAIGFDIDAGNGQELHDIAFH